MRMASGLLIQHLHLIRSAPGQNEGAKPRGSSPRERSQHRAAMLGDEVACPPGGMGLPLGRSPGRASPLWAKSALSGQLQTDRVPAYADSEGLTTPVRPAVTSCTWSVHSTDEVPRRPGLTRRVTPGYKLRAKGPGYASEPGAASLRLRLKGCQQRQSRDTRHRLGEGACPKRQNHRVPGGPGRFMGSVSPAVTAPKWPGGTSSLQTAGLLRNKPQQPHRFPQSVSPR